MGPAFLRASQEAPPRFAYEIRELRCESLFVTDLYGVGLICGGHAGVDYDPD